MNNRITIESIAVALPSDIIFEGKTTRTSIFKKPVYRPVSIRRLNIEGDKQSDLSVHGGRDKAIYVYSSDYYSDWSHELGVATLDDSQFGENLTVSAATDPQVIIGSRFALGTAEVTVTQPRIPCFKLGIRLRDTSFPNLFWTIGKLGFYLRVDREGVVETGQSMQIMSVPDHGITIRDLYEIVIQKRKANAHNALQLLPHLDDGWIRRLRAVGAPNTARD